MTILAYLKSRKYFIVLPLLCSLIHIIVLFVYGCETEPVWYAALIYLALMVVLIILDYWYQNKKYKLLRTYDSNTDKSLQELVAEKDPVAGAYRDIVLALERRQTESTNAYLQKEKESSDFYTMWVHQIKTPIAALHILLQTSPENISGMKGELFKIERYVDIILNYLRMEDMNQDLLLKRYSLESVVKQAVKKYSPLFIQSRLSLKLEDLDTAVLTDEKWIVFVLEQLLSNALKYTKTGGIRIHATMSEAVERKTTRLTIEDTGIGIYPEDLPRIFERAFTGYNGRDDKRASGLGLYLCKNILERLGHEISITSVPGEGTSVTITFHEDGALCGNLTKM